MSQTQTGAPFRRSRVSPGTLSLIELAKNSGVPKDSLQRFLTAGYIPQPKQLLFHAAARDADSEDNANEIAFGGARGGAKTHATFAQVALDDCQRIPGLKVLFLRKVSKAANEAVEDLRAAVLSKTPHIYKEQKSTIVFPNRSRIIIGHFQYEKDIDNYLGLEYDIIVIEEATQLSQAKIDKIKTCNRSSKPDFRPRRYYTTNPGGVGHGWFKRVFIVPFRQGPAAEQANKTKFIPSTVRDNKHLNPEYIHELQALTGWLRKAWLDGDWDIFAGQYFENFSYATHVDDPRGWPNFREMHCEFWCSLDYGFKHWTVCYLFTEYDGVIYCLDEFAARKSLIGPNCQGIHEMLARHGLAVGDLINFVAGADVFAKKGDTGECFADEFERHGIYLRAANMSRRAGWGKILQLLGDETQHIEPSIKISSRCAGLTERLPALMHNPNDPEDVLKVDTDEHGEGGDDHPDAFRYGVMNNNSLGVTI